MKKFLLLIILSSVSLLTCAQTGNGYKKAVIEFMEVTNAKESTFMTLHATCKNMNLQFDNMDKMCEEIVEAIWPNIINGHTTILQEYFTLNELNEIINFYKTPTGKKFAKYNPEIVQKAMESGMSSEVIDSMHPILLKYVKNL